MEGPTGYNYGTFQGRYEKKHLIKDPVKLMKDLKMIYILSKSTSISSLVSGIHDENL